MLSFSLRLFLAAFLAFHSGLTFAQHKEQQELIDRLALLSFASPMCEQMGFEVAKDIDEKAPAIALKRLVASGMNEQEVAAAITRAVDLIEKSWDADQDALMGSLKSSEDFRRLKDFYYHKGLTCFQLANDPLFRSVIAKPASLDLAKAATEMADAALWQGGLASWQTPAIRARGDLLYAIGACRKFIGAEADELLKLYNVASTEQQRKYNLYSYEAGLDNGSMFSDIAQCRRAIPRMIASLGKAGDH